MQFEEWCSQEGFIEKAEKCAKEFINQMKLLDIKMFLNIFENFNMENVQYQFHSASYVINYNKQKEKNYSIKVCIECDDFPLANYIANFNLDGTLIEEYLLIDQKNMINEEKMNLEDWIKRNNLFARVKNDLDYYIKSLEKEDEEEYRKLFPGNTIDDVEYEIYNVSYVINRYFVKNENEERKNIVAKVYLKIKGEPIAEYTTVYDESGAGVDDYLINIPTKIYNSEFMVNVATKRKKTVKNQEIIKLWHEI